MGEKSLLYLFFNSSPSSVTKITTVYTQVYHPDQSEIKEIVKPTYDISLALNLANWRGGGKFANFMGAKVVIVVCSLLCYQTK